MWVEIYRKRSNQLVWSGTLEEYSEAKLNGNYWPINKFTMRYREI